MLMSFLFEVFRLRICYRLRRLRKVVFEGAIFARRSLHNLFCYKLPPSALNCAIYQLLCTGQCLKKALYAIYVFVGAILNATIV